MSVDCAFLPNWPLFLAADPGAGNGLMQFLILFAPLLLIWYFLIIRPQQRQRAKLKDMLENLKTGDKVVTSGGVYGTIMGFRETVVQLQVAPQVKLDVARSAITGLQPSEEKSDNGGGRESIAKARK
ncbi:MAG: preprotein translocase subunit YajC [Terriglobia bacterium]